MASVKVHTQKDSGPFSSDYSLLTEVEVSSATVQDEHVTHEKSDNFNFTNMQSALASPSSDSSVEVHSQINNLIEENNQLKEKLDKNCSMMEKLKQAEERILSLESENSELHQNILDLNEKKGPESCLRCTTLEAGLNNMLGIDYIEDNEHLLLGWSDFRENLYTNLKYVCENLQAVSDSKKTAEEKYQLDCYILMLQFKIAFLEGYYQEGQFASLQVDEETGFEIIRLKARENSQILKVEIEELRKHLKQKDKQLTDLETEKENLVKKIKTHASKLQECEMALKSQCELQNSKLKTESSLHQQCIEREKITAIQAKCKKLQMDYDRVTKLLEIQTKDEKEKNKEIALKQNVVKKYMEEADHLTVKLVKVQEQLDEKNDEIKDLQDQLAQVKQDAKNKTHKNQADDSSRRPDEPNQSGEASIIVCPICSRGFTSEKAAVNHVNRCIEEA